MANKIESHVVSYAHHASITKDFKSAGKSMGRGVKVRTNVQVDHTKFNIVIESANVIDVAKFIFNEFKTMLSEKYNVELKDDTEEVILISASRTNLVLKYKKLASNKSLVAFKL